MLMMLDGVMLALFIGALIMMIALADNNNRWPMI
jgi:hypothetical protein|nr:MAG TPA: hypothetical protein [Caudoviricetes sp.]